MANDCHLRKSIIQIFYVIFFVLDERLLQIVYKMVVPMFKNQYKPSSTKFSHFRSTKENWFTIRIVPELQIYKDFLEFRSSLLPSRTYQ